MQALNSVCLLCGHIWWNAKIAKCPKCKGLCVVRGDDDLALMGRAKRTVEGIA